MNSRSQYRPEIDGLRAIAVLPVIFFHSGIQYFSGGYIGVDVFFVISGYLITSILLDDIYRDNFSFLNFYERRVRRILPALYSVLILTLILSMILFVPHDFKRVGQGLVSTVLFASNFLFFITTDYFNPSSELEPLLHTWSLAVEEQYYFFIPILLIVFLKLLKLDLSNLLIIFFLMFLVSFGLANYEAFYGTNNGFYLTHFRAWELLTGSIAAITMNLMKQEIFDSNFSEILAFLGFTLIILGIFLFDSDTPFPSVYTLAPVLGTFLIIVFSKEGHFLSRFLSTKSMLMIGLMSYSIYLFHQPIFVFYRYVFGEIDFLGSIATLCVTFFCAYLSWRFIENPFRNRKIIPTKKLFISVFILSLFIVFIGILIQLNDGFSKKDFISRLDFPECEKSLSICSYGNLDSNKKILLLGDSTIGQLANDLIDYYGNSHRLDYIACGSCLMIEPKIFDKFAFDAKELITHKQKALSLKNENYDTIIISQRWETYLTDSSEKEEKIVYQSLGNIFNINFSQLILIGGIPEIDYRCKVQDFYNKLNLTECKDFQRSFKFNQSFTKKLSDYDYKKNVKVFDPSLLICDFVKYHCNFSDQYGFIFADQNHLSARGSRIITSELIELINQDS